MSSSDSGFEKRRVRRVSVRSVVAVAAVFNVVLGIAFFIAGWLVLVAAGHAGLFDDSGATPGTTEGPSLSQLVTAWLAIVAGWVVVMTLVWALAAVVLNWSARRFGGIEVEVTPTTIDLRDERWQLPVLVEQQPSRDLHFVPDMVDSVPSVHPANK